MLFSETFLAFSASYLHLIGKPLQTKNFITTINLSPAALFVFLIQLHTGKNSVICLSKDKKSYIIMKLRMENNKAETHTSGYAGGRALCGGAP